MAVITVPVTEEGIVISGETAQALGCRTGSLAEVEIRVLPSAEEIQDRALYYIVHHLGDAVYVGDPIWLSDAWKLPLKVKGLEGVFGHLILSPRGEVIEARSTSRMELREAIRAARANLPPAR
ncbi:MAG: hypothetical protein HY321_06260 [Armatimonadetes bacterium]|nr:hypothetical protein [Armatimonadota bacterium]